MRLEKWRAPRGQCLLGLLQSQLFARPASLPSSPLEWSQARQTGRARSADHLPRCACPPRARVVLQALNRLHTQDSPPNVRRSQCAPRRPRLKHVQHRRVCVLQKPRGDWCRAERLHNARRAQARAHRQAGPSLNAHPSQPLFSASFVSVERVNLTPWALIPCAHVSLLGTLQRLTDHRAMLQTHRKKHATVMGARFERYFHWAKRKWREAIFAAGTSQSSRIDRWRDRHR